MIRNTRFNASVFCIAVLVFSLQFPTYAQQNSVPVAAETIATQDAKTIRSEAKVAAERDARNDINQLFWLGAGVGISAAGCLGGIVGALVGDFIAPRDSSKPSGLSPFDDISGGAIVAGSVGCATGLILSFLAVYKYQSQPPPERLIGKSLEYVEFYTNAYKAKSRSLQTKWAAIGAAIPIAIPILLQ